MPPRSFAVSYDRVTLTVTGLVTLFLIALAVILDLLPLYPLALLMLVLGFAWSPRGYTVGERRLTIRRWAGDVAVPLDGLREARIASCEDTKGAIRWMGSGGLFGYYGTFQLRKYGMSDWYVTNRRRMVLLVTGNKTVMVSPNDPDAFLNAVTTEVPPTAPVAAGTANEPATARRRPLRWALAVAGVLLGVAAVWFVTFSIRYAPGPPRYTLHSDTLAIQDRFYPVTIHASSVDAAGIRVVDFARDQEWSPRARTNGFANSHYLSGWYRAANGERMRLYWAHGSKLVLIPDREAPVLIEAVDADALAGELRRAWAH